MKTLKQRTVLSFIGCIFCLFTILSCNNFFEIFDADTSISVYLPETSARAANASDYSYKISFIHASGTTVLEGNGGAAVTLESAEVGDYTITGQAFDSEQKLAYEGSTTVTIAQGDKAEVTLTLKKVEDPAVTKHMILEPDAAGIKITLRYAEGDKPWDVDYTTEIWDKATDTGLAVFTAPTAEKPVVYYFPFTEKGKKYDITLGILYKDGTWEEETGTCEAGGGDISLFTYNENYEKAEIVLDSENFSGYLTKDTSSIFNNEAVKKLCSKVEFDFPLSTVVADGSTRFVGNQNFYYYLEKEGFYKDPANQIVNPVSFYKDHYKDIPEFAKVGKWTAERKFWIDLKAYPEVRYRTKRYKAEALEFKTPKGVTDTKHMHVENCAEGVKIVLKYLPEDKEWQNYTSIKDFDVQVGISGYNNEFPSAANKEITYIYPLTKKGEMCALQLEIGQLNSESIFENVYITPEAGMKDIIVIGDELSKASINLDETTMKASASTDLVPLVFSEDAIKTGKFTTINYEFTVVSGKSDWSDTKWVAGKTIPYVVNGIEHPEVRAAMCSEILITDIDSNIKYKLGDYNTWGTILLFKFVVAGSTAIFESQSVASEYPYTGPKYDIVDSVTPTGSAGWNLREFYLQEDNPGYTHIESTTDSVKFKVEKAPKQDDFKFQIERDYTSEVGKKYYISGIVITDSICEFDIGLYDREISETIWATRITTTANAEKSIFDSSVTSIPAGSSNCSFWIMPRTAGEFKFTELAINEN